MGKQYVQAKRVHLAHFWAHLSQSLGPDYMANFSPATETNPLKTKLSITWRWIQPGLKILARYRQTGLGFSARPNGPENLKKFHVIEAEFQPRRACVLTVFSHLSKLSHGNLRPGLNLCM